MTPETAILVAIVIPLVGALAIALAGRISANLREAATAITSVSLIWVVWSLLPILMDGGRPSVEVSQVMPGLSIAFTVEPLGMLFAALASGLWLINSIYSVGYMRGNKEKNQTRFFACFALALSATIGVAFAGNLFTLFLFYELLTLSTYPLVAHKGDAATVRSARIYLGVLL
ncbi:MAG: multicomponent Na+:H+ antiporter subunit D, partial [Paraglaciecola sp.]